MEDNTNINEVTSAEEGTKTYSEKDLQSYADKRVTEALKTARSKFENEKKEAERLASMSAEERYTEELSKREAELTEREKKITLLENKNAASAILSEKGISISLVDLVLADSAEEMKSKIALLEKEFNASVQKEIEVRLQGKSPAQSPNSGEMGKADFNKLSLVKQQELYRTNPELFKGYF